MTIETLTDEERVFIRRCFSHPSVLKALRIIDQQNAALTDANFHIRRQEDRIAEALAILATPGTWSEFAARARKALTYG